MSAGRKNKTVGIDGRSALRAATLAALLEDPGYGWDIARRVNRRMGASWRLDSKHIYPVIAQLVADGLVRAVHESTSRHPQGRTVYYPTEEAERARRDWLAMAPTTGVIRADLHIRLVFSTEEDSADLLRALEERRLEILEEIEENAASEAPRVSWLGTMVSLQRSAVDKRLKAEMEWTEDAVRELETLREKRSGA